jgi:transcriptional regulator with XRE-family HTH domain
MNSYFIPDTDSAQAIGERAERLRRLLGYNLEEVAAKASVAVEHVSALEKGEDIPLSSAIALHKVLSTGDLGEVFFSSPKFSTIEDVKAFERRRLGKQ